MSTFLTQIISIVMSILCAFNIVSSTDYKKTTPKRVPQQAAEEVVEETPSDSTDIELVEDEKPATTDENKQNEDTQIIEKTNNEQDPDTAPVEDTNNTVIEESNPQATEEGNTSNEYNDADPAEDNKFENYEVLETIDISATEADDVTMTLYAAPQSASPRMSRSMAATYASVTREESTIYSANGPVIVAYVSGDGNMEDNVYRHFVNVDSYIAEVKNALGKAYGLDPSDIRHELPDGVKDLIEVDMQIEYFAKVDCGAGPAGSWLEITDDVRDYIEPSKALEYSPKYLEFDGDITSVSEGAFLFCNDLVSIEIPSTVKSIGENAFTYCANLKEVILNEGLETIGARAFMQCRSLEVIKLPSTIKLIEEEAFIDMKEGSRILCPTDEVFVIAAEDGLVTPDITTVGMYIRDVAE